MKQIPLTRGMNVIVDDRDFDYLNQYKWIAQPNGQTFYAVRTERGADGKRRTVRMHRVIMNVIDPKIFVDHSDHNGLNNQRSNLRACTSAENCSNRSRISGSSSKFVGVTKVVKRGTPFYYAQIRKNGKTHFLGSFPYSPEGEQNAAIAYDAAAKDIHGDFANLNFKP